MQSSTNLNYQISADASKFNAELRLVEAQMKSLGRQIDKAVKTGDVAGAKQLSLAFGEAKVQAAGLTRELAKTDQALTGVTRSAAISTRSFRSLEQALFGLGKTFGGVQAGLIAFGAARVFSALNDQIDEYRKKLLELRDISQQTMQAPAVVKAAEDISKSLGRSAEDATKMLTGVAEALAKVRTEAGAPINPSGIQVLRGMGEAISGIQSGVVELRGSSKIVFDLQKAYQLLSINANNYKGTQQDILRLQRDTFTAFQRVAQLKLFDPVQLNELSKVLFKGLPADAALKLAPQLIAQLNAEIAKNAQLAPDIAAEEQRQAAMNRLTKMVDDQIAEHNRLWTSVQTASANALANFIESIPAWVAGWEKWKEGNKAAVDEMVAYCVDAATRIANALSQAFASARQTLATSFPGDPSIPAMPTNAAGGYITGPGTGTSDSIVSRLSNGEFVMRARAVEHFGPRFFAALNNLRSPFGYASGGLVMPQRALPHFADGGLVTAGAGGAPVHLHLGGNTFALSGASHVVDALVVEARRQQVRSAGVKPSWFAGRPSG